jgi:hypothetical protein
MTALLKPMELVRAISSQLKTLCEVNYAAFILKHMWVPVRHHMGKFALPAICTHFPLKRIPLHLETHAFSYKLSNRVFQQAGSILR